MPAYLDTIVAAHRRVRAADERDADRLLESVTEAVDCGAQARRDFRGTIDTAATRQGMALIAEIKRRSPSKGELDGTLDAAEVAKEYEAGGASCLSVLTDETYFGGSREDLVAARSSCTLPVLRKDFTVHPLDVIDAGLMGADAVLLIVAALSDVELRELLGLARTCSLTALIEVHDDAELHRALDAGADLVGVNQRDLRTFAVDHERAVRLGSALPDHVIGVAESGIRSAADVRRLHDAGFRAVLVGESLVRAGDRREAVSELIGLTS